jgi:hypothetical protein
LGGTIKGMSKYSAFDNQTPFLFDPLNYNPDPGTRIGFIIVVPLLWGLVIWIINRTVKD